MPWSMVPALIAYRKSWFDEVGAKSFPKTWQEYQVGKKLKAAKHPIGQTLGNTFGDAPTFTYPFLWSFGGQEVDAKGKVVLDSKETVESVRFMTQFWKDAHDEGGLAWDDSNNNRAFLSGDISASLNGASIYVAALNGADKFKTEKGAPLHTDILHAPLPRAEGRARLPHRVQPHGDEVLEERQGRDRVPALGAQEENYEKWFTVQKGFAVGPTKEWENHAMWKQDPVMAPFRTAPQAEAADGLRRPARQEGRRGVEQVHRHRDVRPGVQRQDEARRGGEVGRGRAGQGLHRGLS